MSEQQLELNYSGIAVVLPDRYGEPISALSVVMVRVAAERGRGDLS
jgi:DNA-binding IclR family transcriptional regulator